MRARLTRFGLVPGHLILIPRKSPLLCSLATMPPSTRRPPCPDPNESLADRILAVGIIVDISCDRCSISKPVSCCRKMADRLDLKCERCTRQKKPCVSSSWVTLDRDRDRLREDLVKDEKEQDELLDRLAELRARVSRKRKVLEQAEERSRKKLSCLVDEARSEGIDMNASFREPTEWERFLFDDLPVPVLDASSPGGTSLAVPDTR